MTLTKEERDKLRAWHGTGPEDVDGMKIIDLLDDLDAKDAEIEQLCRTIADMPPVLEPLHKAGIEIQDLRQERDEARSGWEDAVEAVREAERERDEALARLAEQDAEIADLKAIVARMEAALRVRMSP